VQEQLVQLRENLLGLGHRRLAAMGLIGFVVFAAIALGSYYLSRPSLETLYTGLDNQDITRIGAALNDARIPFDVSSDGTTVLVRYGSATKARMLLAEEGLPRSENSGYELLDKLGSIGLTSFMQKITQVRVLEGEIARTIQAMNGVKAARVHIVMPDGGSFRRSRRPPSASVVIRLDRTAHRSTARAIRHLVAAAIPAMTVDEVTVLSTDGTILSSRDDTGSAMPARMMELEKTIGNELKEKIHQTLTPYLGLDNFEISVVTRLNIDKRQSTEKIFDPESRVERSVKVVKENETAQNKKSDAAVGADQNLPDGGGGASKPGDQSSQSNQHREELTNYELSSKTIATVSQGYRIENVSIAIVVNRKRLAAGLGAGATPEALTAQVKEIERIAASAAGIDAKRGDHITVSLVDFIKGDQNIEAIPAPGFTDFLVRQSANFMNAATVLIATLLLIWFGLRPAIRLLLEKPDAAITDQREDLVSLGSSAPAPEDGANMAIPTMKDGLGDARLNLVEDLQNEMNMTPQRRLEQIVDLDQEKAVAVLRQWAQQPGTA